MKLYTHPFSPNARRAHMTALQLGLPLEVEVVDLQKGAHRQPPFLQMNPNGKVPVLDDDGLQLWESHAIMLYLADKADNEAGRRLYPRELKARADVHRWLFWNASHFMPAVSTLAWERMIKGMFGQGAPDPTLEAMGEKNVTTCATLLDAHLAGRKWISGDDMTLADLAIAPALAHTEAARLPVKDHANVQAWFGRVQELEAWKKTAM